MSDLLRTAAWLIRSGRNRDALPLLDQIIAADPRCQFAFRERARARAACGDLPGAMADLATVTDGWPDDPVGLTDRAFLREQAGDSIRAVLDYTAAIARNSAHPFAYLRRGRLRAAAGHLAAAVADFTEHMEHDPLGRLSGLLNRGPARHRMGDSRGALDDLTESMGLECHPPVFAPLFRGRVRLATADYLGALDDFTAAIAAFPQLTNAYRHRAEAKTLAGDPTGAAEDLQHYARLGGRDLPAYA